MAKEQGRILTRQSAPLDAAITVLLLWINVSASVTVSEWLSSGSPTTGVPWTMPHAPGSLLRGSHGLDWVYSPGEQSRLRSDPLIEEFHGLKRHQAPGLIQCFSPLVISLSLSVLVVLSRGNPPANPGFAAYLLGTPETEPGWRSFSLTRYCLTRMPPLIALFLASLAYRPPVRDSEIMLNRGPQIARDWPPSFQTLFGGKPRTITIRVDGRTTVSRACEVRCEPESLLNRLPRGRYSQSPPLGSKQTGVAPPAREAEYDMEEATIEYGWDDSIVTYGGTYDHKLSQPFVIRNPSRSAFEIWWPTLVAVLATGFVALDLGLRLLAARRARRSAGF